MIEHINALDLVLDVDAKSRLMDILLFQTVIECSGHHHSKLFDIDVWVCELILIINLMYTVRLPERPSTSSSDVTSTPGRSFSRLGSTLRGSTRRGNKHSKVRYEKLEG